MSQKIGEVFVNVGAVLDDLYKGFDKAKTASGQFEKQSEKIFKGIGAKIGAALSVAAAVKFFADSTKAASNATEINQKFAVTFDEVSAKADEAAKSLAMNYGLARSEAKAMLSATGDLLTGLGVQKDTALDLSVETQQLATDLASFSNYAGGAQGASEALTKAMLGEREQIKSLGIVITEQMVKEELAAQGKDKLTGLAYKQAQAYATLKLATDQSKNAIGDFARSMDSPANVMRRVTAQMKDFQEEVGSEIAPALGRLGTAFLNASKDGGFLQDVIKKIAGVIASMIDSITMLINIFQAHKLEKEMKRLDVVTEKSREAFSALRAEMKMYGEQLKKNDIKQEEYNMHMERLKIAMETNIKDRQRLTDEYERSGKEIEALRIMNEKLRDGTYTEVAAVNASAEAHRQNAEAKRESASASGELARATVETAKIEFDSAFSVISDFVSSSLGSLSELFDMSASNQSIAIENELDNNLSALDKWYKAEQKNIKDTIKNKKARDKALAKLDEEYYARQSDYETKADKEKAKLQRESAKRSKDMAIFEAVISTATGAVQAYQGMVQAIPGPAGMILGAIAAAAMVAFGAIKVSLIESQPLPQAAEGMYSEGPAIFGEAGPELAVPLSSARGKAAISLLASGMLDAMTEKTGTGGFVESVKETAQTITGDVILYGEKIGQFISEGTKNGQILISERAVV